MTARALLRSLLFAGACVAALPQAMACYTVYDASNRVVYSAQEPPVDMRYQIHETLPRVFPNSHMVFGDEPDCPLTDARLRTVATVAAAPQPARYRVLAVVSTAPQAGGLAPRADRN